ncbi:hypothetical protein BDU57DRAFT_528013 [Ampelomyces quisqualis]|uniref:Protein kinase domain-containing protein n=1 Tax=Ampelomyces quisqualis TaxID=50730 RepID=A0A6A5QRB4_AMPQU|nr:hypothetical protein BDU57DRAFT_528013 [Ampelomyces quisqualis]
MQPIIFGGLGDARSDVGTATNSSRVAESLLKIATDPTITLATSTYPYPTYLLIPGASMPDNTWFTPYRFPPSTCLSMGPSQGIVYAISDSAVVKLPFKYPVAKSLPTDNTIEQMHISLQSLAVANKESKFYNILANYQHPNLAQRLQSQLPIATRHKWIKQLVSAVAWLEQLGYTHRDLKVLNIGIDAHKQLQLFDFGSVRHRDDVGYTEQVVEDQFALATCIHFLASGIDLVAKAKSRVEARATLNMLKGGRAVVYEAAKEFEKVIQAGWAGDLPDFSSLSKGIGGFRDHTAVQLEEFSPDVQLNIDYSRIEEDYRWKEENSYRAAWKAKGYEVPDNIWDYQYPMGGCHQDAVNTALAAFRHFGWKAHEALSAA